MIVARFRDEAELRQALTALREAGLDQLETYTPRPFADGSGSSPVPLIVLAGFLAGAAASFGLQAYSRLVAYPFNLGHRPAFAWASFVPNMFENGVLVAIVAGFASFLLINRMPRLYEPIDETEAMRSASSDGWVVAVEARDPQRVAEATRILHERRSLSLEEIEA